MVLVLLKIAAGNQTLATDLHRWVDQLHAVLDRSGGVQDFTSLLRYIEHVGEAPADQLQDLVNRLGPQAQEAFMTTAEMLRAEGRAEALVQLLTLKFGPLPPDTLKLVHTATIDQIETWTARLLTAKALHQVLP